MPSLICPSCRHSIDFTSSRIGQRVTCANCGKSTVGVAEHDDVSEVGSPREKSLIHGSKSGYLSLFS